MKLYIKANNIQILENLNDIININNPNMSYFLSYKSNKEYIINNFAIKELNELKEVLFYDNQALKNLIRGIYFGNSYCEHCLSSISEIKKAQAFCKSKLYNFVFVFPALSENKITEAKEILNILSKSVCEVVVNDFGTLELAIQTKNIKPILGINFTKTIKNAFVDNIKPNIRRSIFNNQQELLNHIEFENENIRAFYKELGISRFSAENKLFNFDFISQNPYMQVDIYYPYINVSSARACNISGLFNDKSNYFPQIECKQKYCNNMALNFPNSDVLGIYQKYTTIYKYDTEINIPKQVYKTIKNRLVWEVFR